jgi:2-oxoglutarate ferredoxin oxidoreductase subunit delta
VAHLERRNGFNKVKKSDKKEPKANKKIEINRDLCKGCGICVAFCQKKVLEVDEQDKAVARRPEDCNACTLCELRCPDMALEIKGDEGE